MIKFSKILLLLISSFTLFGCYTVAWQPGEALPTKDNLKKNLSNFYSAKDFGVFNPYYNLPWWLNPDNDLLRDNFNTIMEINDAVDEIIDVNEITRDRVHEGIPPIILVAPPSKVYTVKSKERKTATPLIKTTNSKVRNSNGGRKNRKGRSR